MRKLIYYFFVVVVLLCLSACGQQYPGSKQLEGKAEDLWGNRIDLSKYNKGIVLIHPFSPSNCGYCFIDGEFVRENYYKNTEKQGGTFFGMCLFNPQLDIYSLQKHFRDEFPVITAPVSLHSYHQDGFPYMIAFKNGESIYSNTIWPYEESFHILRTKLWKVNDIRLHLTSPLHMATRFTGENISHLALFIYPDGDEARFKRAQEQIVKIQQRMKELDMKGNAGFTVKYESQLTHEDYKKNLLIEGVTEQFNFKSLEGKDIPIKITSDSIHLGDYEFPKSEVGLNVCFPNPFNSERYLILKLRGSKLKSNTFENWVDYTIYRDDSNGKPEILLHGLFDKYNGKWKFSHSLAYGPESSKEFCKKGICPAPIINIVEDETNKEPKTIQLKYEKHPKGELWTLGKSECRFPSLIVDRDGICWVVWEEKGDIILSSVNKKNDQEFIYIEDNPSDSFNPIIAMDKESLWIFYLNNQDGFYRLYGKYFDGQSLSDEILFSEKEPMDVITPTAAFNTNGEIILAWSEWKANNRFPKYRTLEDRILGEVQTVQTKRADIDYTCAWYPSLVLDDSGKVWGAWNQHYPAPFGVYAGDLIQEAMAVTDNNAGYPSIILDQHGKPWVFWESFMWDVLERKPQTISASYYNLEKQQWSLPYTISLKSQSTFNQTPKAAIDEKGIIWVVWSGRKDESGPWNIYISHYEEKKWSKPEVVSSQGENARAPAIFINKSGEIWITWHSGIGPEMKVKVLQFPK